MIVWDLPSHGTQGATGSVPRPGRVQPRVSAGVIPYRFTSDGTLEIYWVRRSKALRFMGGWNAFPGGRRSRGDASLAVRGSMDGKRAFLESGPIEDQPASALRELFEETGILVAGGGPPRTTELETARDALLADELDFGAWLAERGLVLDASRLRFAGRWVTPPLSPIRFDATFFLLEWPPDEPAQPTVIPGELASGEWVQPGVALDQWLSGEVLLAQPTLETIRVLSDHGPDGRDRLWLSESRQPDAPRSIEFRPAVRAIPVRTRTLPPATHTNTLLLGDKEMVLIDPGCSDPSELRRLQDVIDAETDRSGGKLCAIWLSHHHIDHVAGTEALRRHFSVPVSCHPATAARLRGQGIVLEGRLKGGESIDLAGTPTLRIRVLHTPGHASGHLCFLEGRSKTLLCGDMLSGWGTVVISPPDGNMGDYLRSLERLAVTGARAALPSHGSMLQDVREVALKARDHRLWREDRVLAAWNSGLRVPANMLDAVYGDLEPGLRPLAERQVLAHLEHLEQVGRLLDLPRAIRDSLEHDQGVRS